MLISVPDWLQRYLLNLGPVRAFRLFIYATFLGSASVLTDVGMPVVPIAVVLFYGIILWLGQTRHFTQLSPVTKDSPYFLGFVLTLIALIGIFGRMSQDGTGSELLTPYLFRGTATALGTTIIGLVLRQLLHASDPIEHDRDEIFQTLAQELKDQTKSFARSQRRLVDLIQEFTETREEMLSREEQVFSTYLSQLQRTVESLASIEQEYTSRVDDALETISASAESAAGQAEDSVEQLESSRHALSEMLNAYENTLTDVRETNRKAIEKIQNTILTDTEKLGTVTRQLAETVESSLSRIAKIPDEQRNVVSDLTGAARKVTDPIEQVGGDLQEVHSRLEHLSEELDQLPGRLRSTVVDLDRVTQERERIVVERLDTVVSDLKALDAVVDQLTTLLERRIGQTAQ